MGKMLIFLYLVFLTIMFTGAIMVPQSPVFWVASVTATYQSIRLVVIIALVLQLVTRPPRRVWLRALTGAMAAATVVWAIQQTYAYQMLPFDTLSIVGASIAIIVTALEVKTVGLKFVPNSVQRQT